MRPSTPAEILGQRLRNLRARSWRTKVTQSQLATALGRSAPSISAWERGIRPPIGMLRDYAVFFSTPRSIAGPRPRLLRDDELTGEEQARRDELERELLVLYYAAARGAMDTDPPDAARPTPPEAWRFPQREPVTIVCAELPEELRIPYADPTNPDFVEFYRYTDLDSLIEVYGHIRAVNPVNPVRICTGAALDAADYGTHLVLLGGVDWNPATALILRRLADELPVRQLARDSDSGGGCFRVGDRTFEPVLTTEDGQLRLVEDVAHFFRGPNPMAANRTVTMCNGMYARGTLGAVRALTDARLRERNAAYLDARFGSGRAFSILSRVGIVRDRVVTPDWQDPATRLHEWP